MGLWAELWMGSSTGTLIRLSPIVHSFFPVFHWVLYISKSTISALNLRWAPWSNIVATWASSGSITVICGEVVVYRRSFRMPQPTNDINYSRWDHLRSVGVCLRERKATGTSYGNSLVYVAAKNPTPSHADGYIVRGWYGCAECSVIFPKIIFSN